MLDDFDGVDSVLFHDRCFFCSVLYLLSDFDTDWVVVDIVHVDLTDTVDFDTVVDCILLLDCILFLHDFGCNFDCFFYHFCIRCFVPVVGNLILESIVVVDRVVLADMAAVDKFVVVDMLVVDMPVVDNLDLDNFGFGSNIVDFLYN